MQELHLHTCVTGRIYSLESPRIDQLNLDGFDGFNRRGEVRLNNTVGDVDRIAERECAVGNQRIEQLVADGCATE